jgi:ligand-binding sensor domain-containing protein
MKKYWNIFVVFLIVLFLPSRSHAQSPGIICRHYNIQNGLISNNIEYVYVDREGYTWLATANGLQQFDGYNFTNYNYNADDTSSISYNFISSISEDTSGNIWIGTVGKGINILNKKKRIFYHLYNDPSHPQILTSNNIPRGQQDFALDEGGSMWVNTDNGLNKISTSDFLAEHYIGDFTGEILYDKTEKVLWIASNILKKFNPATNQIDYYQISSKSTGNQVKVNSFLMDDKGLFWLGTTAGLLIFDKTKRHFYTLDEYYSDSPTYKKISYEWSSNAVECIYADNQGFIWIAIDKNIVRLDKYHGYYQLFAHEIDNPGSLQDSKVVGIYGNNSRALWVAYTTMGV